jgi:hypothetical protein
MTLPICRRRLRIWPVTPADLPRAPEDLAGDAADLPRAPKDLAGDAAKLPTAPKD